MHYLHARQKFKEPRAGALGSGGGSEEGLGKELPQIGRRTRLTHKEPESKSEVQDVGRIRSKAPVTRSLGAVSNMHRLMQFVQRKVGIFHDFFCRQILKNACLTPIISPHTRHQ
jgi:hypothetical protein